MPLAGRNVGRSSVNGSGTSGSNWVISLPLSLRVSPRLLLPSPRPPNTPLPHRAMHQPRWPYLSNETASRGETLCFTDGTLRCPAWKALAATNSAEKAMAVSVSCMQDQPVSSLSLATTVSVARQEHPEAASSECAAPSPRCWLGPSALAGLESEYIDGTHQPAASPTGGSRDRTSQPGQARNGAADPFVGQCVPIIGSRGRSDWRAMPMPQRLAAWDSTCSASPKPLSPRSA